MYTTAKSVYAAQLAEIEAAGTWKHERQITSPQAAHIRTNGAEVLNFCANNYLGLSSHPRVIAAAHAALDDCGYGLSSVRFICGTQDAHKELEARSRSSSAPRTRSSTPRASTRTAACSRRCSARTTRSSPTRSTTPRSSTAFACARPSASATSTMI